MSGQDVEETWPWHPHEMMKEQIPFFALEKMDMTKLKDPYEEVLHKDSTYFMAEDI